MEKIDEIENEVVKDIEKFLYSGEKSFSFLEIAEENKKRRSEEKRTGEAYGVDFHDNISSDVFRRLIFRHAILRKLIKLESSVLSGKRSEVKQEAPCVASNSTLISSFVPGSLQNNASDVSFRSETSVSTKHSDGMTKESGDTVEYMAYNLAVTDLFVEKALAYLDEHAKPYNKIGYAAFNKSRIIILCGIVLAVFQNFLNIFCSYGIIGCQIPDLDQYHVWPEMLSNFTRSFTMYGLIVLMAVAYWRYGKAMLDQAERLYERRHALRQGRLFVHLNDGKLTIEQLEKAFNWNVSQANAFGSMPTEASAPWGAALKEFTKIVPDLAKAVTALASRQKSVGDESDENSKKNK